MCSPGSWIHVPESGHDYWLTDASIPQGTDFADCAGHSAIESWRCVRGEHREFPHHPIPAGYAMDINKGACDQIFNAAGVYEMFFHPFSASDDVAIVSAIRLSAKLYHSHNYMATFDVNGKLHSNAGNPAVVGPNGSYWFDHGVLHRVGAPAVISHLGDLEWYIHGVPHNPDGADIVTRDGRYINYTDEYNERLRCLVLRESRSPKRKGRVRSVGAFPVLQGLGPSRSIGFGPYMFYPESSRQYEAWRNRRAKICAKARRAKICAKAQRALQSSRTSAPTPWRTGWSART